MSPRAAWRLEDLGFPDVAHYAGGVADWMASGLAVEGTMANDLHLAAVARADAPTCGPRETVGVVRERMRAAGWDVCFIVNERRILLGRVRGKDLENVDPGAPAEQAMEPGPVTYRPDHQADELMDVMEQHGIAVVPVTTSDGRLVGAVRREDLERAVLSPRRVHRHSAA